jgi:hypothetical protein
MSASTWSVPALVDNVAGDAIPYITGWGENADALSAITAFARHSPPRRKARRLPEQSPPSAATGCRP